jgi:peroxiredoxin
VLAFPGRSAASALSAGLVALALTATGCVGQNAVSATGDGSGYVAGSGTVRRYAEGHRRAAPTVRGATLEGTTLDLSTYRGHVVVLNFWASWCPPCRDEAAGLAQVERDTAARGVRFLGVNFKDDVANARIFTQRRQIPYPSLFDRYGQIMVRFSASVPPAAIPTTLILDRSGRIAASIYGPVTFTRLAPLVTSVAAERSA